MNSQTYYLEGNNSGGVWHKGDEITSQYWVIAVIARTAGQASCHKWKEYQLVQYVSLWVGRSVGKTCGQYKSGKIKT